jgi:hypothetical protein
MPSVFQEGYMTTAPLPRASALSRGWRNFRRWRRGRPFWGGVVLILSGLELFWSANQDLAGMTVHFGPQGFLSYVIPGIMVLCGLLTLLTPQQRLFYGIVGACTAVFALIGLNLGGFFLGTLLGMFGGALSVSWTRVAPQPPPPGEPIGGAGPDAGYQDAGYQDAGYQDAGYQDAGVDDLMSGPLTDVLPSSLRSPLDRPPDVPPEPPAGPPPAAPPGRLPRRDGRLLAVTLVPLTVGVMVLAGLRLPGIALADQCTPTAGTKPTNTTAAPVHTGTAAPPTTGGPAPTATATPGAGAPAGAPQHQGNSIGDAIKGFLGAIAGLLGGGRQKPAAEPTPSDSAEPTAAPTRTGTPTPPAQPTTPKPTTASPPKPCGPGTVRKLAVDPGQPPVNAVPSIMTADRLTMSGLSFDGVVELPTVKGPLRSLRFSMNKSVASPFELRVPTSGRTLSLASSALTVQGHVKFYASRFAGKLFGLIPVVFTPDSPPPLILPELLFTDVNIELVFVDTDTLTAPDLVIQYAT